MRVKSLKSILKTSQSNRQTYLKSNRRNERHYKIYTQEMENCCPQISSAKSDQTLKETIQDDYQLTHQRDQRRHAVVFNDDEDQKIVQLVKIHGPKFYKIGKKFPGKTISMVKNRFYKFLRYQFKDCFWKYKVKKIEKRLNQNKTQIADDIKLKMESLNLFSDLKEIMKGFINNLEQI
ncbi:hypothetical protein pb186bvf_003191 [Paramecium bursaria]